MNDEPLKYQVLQELAEEGIPVAQDPWPAIHARLSQADSLQALKTTAARSRSFKEYPRLRLASIFIVGLLLLGVLYLVTPAGQGVAQSILKYFRRAENNTLPIPTHQWDDTAPATRTAVPTEMASLATIAPGDTPQFYTPTAQSTPPGSDILTGLTVQQAQDLAGFTVRELVTLPPSYYLAEIHFDPATRSVIQFYKYSPYQSGEMFIFTQQANPPTDLIGPSAQVTRLQVGEIQVEMVSGSWFSAAGVTTETWIADAPVHTYRWQIDGVYCTLQFMLNETFSPAYLSAEDRQAIVELALGQRTALPARLNLNNLPDLAEVERAAGTHVLAPTLLPEGFIFERGVYEPEPPRVVLIYRPQDSSRSTTGASLLIFEIPLAVAQPLATWEGFPDGTVQQVMVGQFPAILVQGALIDGVYDPEAGLSLYWRTNEMQINLRFTGTASYPARLAIEDFLAIADSMK